MASSDSPCSSSALSPVKLSVQVFDCSDPLRTTTCSVLTSSASVSNSSELLLSTTSGVHMSDSNKPLMPSVSSRPVPSQSTSSSETVDDDDGEQRRTTGSLSKHLSADEIRSMWNWRKIFSKLATKEQCLQFAEERGMIPREKKCQRHRTPMTLQATGQIGTFRCRKRTCGSRSVSRAQGTFFENVHLKITSLFQLMYAFSLDLSHHQTQIELATDDDLVISSKTITFWFSYFRESIIFYELEHQNGLDKIGGPTKVVHIDKSMICERKFHSGRNIEGNWVIRMIEDGHHDLRLELCPDNENSEDIFVSIIKKHVQEGSIIHTNCWEANLNLTEHGFIHKQVKHSDLDNSHFRYLRKDFRKNNRKDFTDWVIETNFRRKIKQNHKDGFEELIKAVLYFHRSSRGIGTVPIEEIML
ncbi:unnamed protein product [Colias eurytheme]|nr:unnamed protein product [Colias eurytheme]